MDESSHPSRMLSRDSELPSVANAPVAPATQRGRRIALAVVFLLSFVAVGYVASTLWVGLMLGTVMAFTAQPLYRRLAARMGNRKTLSAVLTSIIGGITVVALTAGAAYVLTSELVVLGGFLQRRMAAGSLEGFLGPRGVRIIDSVGLERATVMVKLQDELARASSYAAEAARLLVATTTDALLTLIIGLFTMYYVLLEWPTIAVRLERLLPLDPRHTRALVLEFRDVGRSAFVGTLATAVVQGIFAGIGFAIAGAPHAVTWGVFTAIGSFIPVVGTACVWVPVGGYLILVGKLWWGIFVFAWGALVVMAASDYIVRPRLVGGGNHGHPLLMLIALLGGIDAFGLAGLIVGPVIMSLFLAILRIYERETSTAGYSPQYNATPIVVHNTRDATGGTTTTDPPPASTHPKPSK